MLFFPFLFRSDSSEEESAERDVEAAAVDALESVAVPAEQRTNTEQGEACVCLLCRMCCICEARAAGFPW